MKLLSLLFAIFMARANSFYQLPQCDLDCNGNETSAREFIDWINDYSTKRASNFYQIYWMYSSNKTDENYKTYIALYKSTIKHTEVDPQALKDFCWENFTDKDLVRSASLLYDGADDHPDKMKGYSMAASLVNYIEKGTVCKYEHRNETKCSVKLRHDQFDEDKSETDTISKKMNSSRDYQELLYYWKEWRKLGKYLRNDHLEYVKLLQKAAKYLGFKNLKERWLQAYEDLNFPSAMQNAYSKQFIVNGEPLSVEKLYKEIHSFVKGKLMTIYNKQGADIKNDGHIPAHLLGTMFAYNWLDLVKMVKPFPNVQAINVTKALTEKKFKPNKIYKAAETFFVGLGFEQMTEKFWSNSIFEKPDDREVNCYSIIWDMLTKDKDDYRIMVCSKMRHIDFDTAFRGISDIAYKMLYRNNPYIYRKEAFPGINAAIGDMMVMGVNTQSYLQHLKVLEPEKTTASDIVNIGGIEYKKRDINDMMKLALGRVVFLPFALTLDSWRWDFFSGKTNETNLNGAYWRLKNDLQGIKEPVPGTEKNLDLATMLDESAKVQPVIQRFFRYIAGFQFHEALCKRAGEYNPDDISSKPLHSCDFTNVDAKAAEPLRNMMKKGRTQSNWTVVMEEATGIPGLSGESMVRYFLPLYKYLKQENKNNGIQPWN